MLVSKNIFAAILCCLLLACGDQQQEVKPSLPMNFEDSDSCHICAMMITAYPGPKGQAVEGAVNQVRKFCSTSDMILWYLESADRNNISDMYVHDISLTPWNNPDDKHLIPAEKAFFVIGSKKNGSMGPTLATFLQEGSAMKFASEHGGRVLVFNDLILELDEID